MVACSRKVCKYEHLPLAEIDTMTLKPDVKSILRKYIKAHPKYQTLLLEQKKLPFEDSFTDQPPYQFIIGPAVAQLFDSGEFGFQRSYPASYFVLDNRLILVQSEIDELISKSKKLVDTYNQLAEPLDSFYETTPYPTVYPAKSYIIHAWVFKTSRTYATELLTTRADTFILPKRVYLNLPPIKTPAKARKAKTV